MNFFSAQGVAIILGLIISVLHYYSQNSENDISMKSDMFLYYFLPPIVLAEGLSIKTKKLYNHTFLIIFYGIASTILTFIWLSSFNFIAISTVDSFENEKLESKEILIISAALTSRDSIISS